MAAQQQRTGKPWSAANPIPNIKQFVEALDRDKANRDREIDEQNKLREREQVKPHKNETLSRQGKWVHDPVTGNQVQIEDVGKDFMKAVKDPMASPCSPQNLLC